MRLRWIGKYYSAVHGQGLVWNWSDSVVWRRRRCTWWSRLYCYVPEVGNPTIPRVWPIGSKFRVKTLVKNKAKLPFLKPWKWRIFQRPCEARWSKVILEAEAIESWAKATALWAGTSLATCNVTLFGTGSELGKPAIPMVILIELMFEVKTLVEKGPNYPVSNPWNDRFFACGLSYGSVFMYVG